ncbi:MAG TPA: alpha/beta fold hydrolase [Bryobacteraceae bacterium]|nr:alpha/beta fold hydrolase [Bryobacteraceae bacterium]
MSRRRWLILVPTLFCVLALLLFAAASALFCEGTLRVPTGISYARNSPGVGWQTVTIRASDGVPLEGWFVRPQNAGGACVIVLHGIADTRSGVAGFGPLFVSQRYSVLVPDSRAHGRSGGEFVTYGLLEKHDVLGWVRWLRGQGCDHVYGLGESLGASILIEASALEPAFRAIVAECAYSDLKSIADERVGQLVPPIIAPLIVRGGMTYARLRYELDFEQVSPVRAIARSTTPTLLIHGLADHRTSCWHSRRLAQANPRATLWLVPKADHVAACIADPEGFRSRVLDWFARH